MILKTCRKCGKKLPATLEFFYRNSGGAHGVTPRCKPCVNEDNRLSHAKRLEANPERIRALASARVNKHYHNNIDVARESSRKSAAKARQNPENRSRINMRKRADGAGMTAEAFTTLFESQDSKCAICQSTEPGSNNPKITWNIDHCHKTGRVRFILCCHCNRGLGAFKDNPSLLRTAAELLEKIYDRQPECTTESRADQKHGDKQENLSRLVVGSD